MISVVIATYNGEKYIEAQLNSVLRQTKAVDEVLIFDDASSDGTVDICRNFINNNHLSTWKLRINNPNKGYVDNFLSGIREASGDIVFLCDQDDIWLSDKVKIMTDALEKNSEILSLTSTFSRIDENGNVLENHVRHPYSKKNTLVKIKAEQFLKFHNYLGMSMAIRKPLVYRVPRSTKNYITHDILLNLYAVESGGLYHLDKAVTIRRSYSSSTSNKKITDEVEREFRGNGHLYYLDTKIKLLDCSQYPNLSAEFKMLMQNYRNAYQKRYECVDRRSFLCLLRNMGNVIQRFGLKECIKDFLYMK